jgi:hypothetical protein
MHLAGFPIAQKINKLCTPEYCQEDVPIGNGRQRLF